MSAPPITRELARFAIGLKYEDIPADVVAKAKDCILDQLGVELIGSTLDWNKIALRYVARMDGRAESTVVNHGTRALALDAAFVNGTFGQGCELDDVGFGAGGHPSAATVPVALALCETEKVSGRDFIAAVVAGWDVMYRLLLSVRPSAARRGFHSHGIGGPFGAVVVAGRLMGLSETEMLNAFGITGSHCGGSVEYDQTGGEVKRVHGGMVARAGIQSAMLAQLGLTGPPTIIEGLRGFCRVFADEYDLDVITRDLGGDFKIRNAWFKMHPCVSTVQGTIDVLADLKGEHGFRADQVREIRVGISETSVKHGGTIYEPHDVASAQFSLPFSLALRLVKDDNSLSNYMDASLWRDPTLLNIAHKVKPHAEPEAKGQLNYLTVMEVDLADGSTLAKRQDYPRGCPRNPVTTQVLQNKFRRLAGEVLPDGRLNQIITRVEHLEDTADASDLVPLLVRNGAKA
jgi:2-methylcitrate dehydratase PrpD